jgi:hypothetical protein
MPRISECMEWATANPNALSFFQNEEIWREICMNIIQPWISPKLSTIEVVSNIIFQQYGSPPPLSGSHMKLCYYGNYNWLGIMGHPVYVHSSHAIV